MSPFAVSLTVVLMLVESVRVPLAIDPANWIMIADTLDWSPLTTAAPGLDPAHLVGIGGAIGALLRYGVYQYTPQDRFPLPTLIVNVVGSFVFGLATFAGAGTSTMQFLGIGVCGSFTTFSAFSVETVDRWDSGERRLAVVNAGANLVCSLAAIALAWLIAASLL